MQEINSFAAFCLGFRYVPRMRAFVIFSSFWLAFFSARGAEEIARFPVRVEVVLGDREFAEVATLLARELKLRQARVEETMAGEAHYNPETQTVCIPRELGTHLRRELDRHGYGPQGERASVAREIVIFAMAHELAHAAHHEQGRSDGEMEADQTAGIALRKALPDRADSIVRSAVDYLNICGSPDDLRRARALAAGLNDE